MRRNSAAAAVAAFVATVAVTGAASGTSLSRRPPVNLTRPSISGITQVGSTLSADRGRWRGGKFKYAYRWQRCHFRGDPCAPIRAATRTTYVLTTSDVGKTVRVAVTARNSTGSATATSAATAVSAALVNSSGGSIVPHFLGDFETSHLNQWDHVYDPNPVSANPPSVVRSPVAQGGYAAKLTVDPNDVFLTGTGNTSSRVDVYNNSRSDLAHEGLDEWVHMYVMFPAWNGTSGYKPTNGEWNWWHQWHATNAFSNESVTGGQPVALGVVTGGALSRCNGSTSSSANPQIFGYIVGGNLATGTTGQTRFCTHRLLKYDHWYNLYEHIVWSKSASIGYYALYVDGGLVVERRQPTLLYDSSTGTVDVPYLELDNYRWNMNGAVNWSSTIYFDGVKVGPARNSPRTARSAGRPRGRP